MDPISRLRIDADVNNLVRIRTFIQDSISTQAVTQGAIHDIVLAVDEAATNIIIHGYQGQPGVIEIEVKKDSNSLCVHLRDQSPGFDPTKVPPPDLSLPLERRPIGNLGLHLMRHLVDEVKYETASGGGNQLTLVKTISSPDSKEEAMTIQLEQAQTNPKVTVLSIQGDLDAANYKDVINVAKEAIESGAEFLLIDMSEIQFMSSSGLIALHTIALLMRGEAPSDPEHGWEAFHALERDLDSGFQEKVKLLNPQPKVDRSLEITGLKEFFEIHTDLDTAVATFG